MKYGKKLGLMVAVVATVMAMSATVFAQDGAIGGQAESMERNGVGVFGGVGFFEDTDPILGVEARFGFDISPDLGLMINPKGSYVFVSSEGDISQTNLFFDINVLAMMDLDGFRPYGGMGLNIWYLRVSAGGDSDSNTEFNPNLLVVGGEFDVNEQALGFIDFQLTRFSVSSVFGSISSTDAMVRAGINFGI